MGVAEPGASRDLQSVSGNRCRIGWSPRVAEGTESSPVRQACRGRHRGLQSLRSRRRPSASSSEQVIVRGVGVAASAERKSAALLEVARRVEDQVLPVAAGRIVARGSLHHGEVGGHVRGAVGVQALDEGRTWRDRSERAQRGVGGGAVIGEDLAIELPREMLRRGARGCRVNALQLRGEVPWGRRWLAGCGAFGPRWCSRGLTARGVLGGCTERKDRRRGGAGRQRRREEDGSCHDSLCSPRPGLHQALMLH